MQKKIAKKLIPYIPAIADETVHLLEAHDSIWTEQYSSEELSRLATLSMQFVFKYILENDLHALRFYFHDLFSHDFRACIHDAIEIFLIGKAALITILKRINLDLEGVFSDLEVIESFYIKIIALIIEEYDNFSVAQQEKEHVRSKLLLEASQAVSSDLTPDEAMQCLARILVQAVGEGSCSIFLLNPETGSLTPQAGWGYGVDICMDAVKSIRFCTQGNELQASDGRTYGLCALSRCGASLAEVLPRSLLTGSTDLFPITSGHKTLGLAVISVNSDSFSFDEDTRSLVTGILNGVSVALESAVNIKHAQRKLKESEGLRRIAHQLLSRTGADQKSVFNLICDEARNIVGGSGSAIFLRDGEELVYTYGTGKPQPPVRTFALHGSRYGEFFLKGKTSIITDASSEIPSEECSLDANTLIVVPLAEGEENVGLLLVFNKKTGFDLDDINIMEMFAAQAVLALRNARLAEQGEKIAVAEERQRLARELHDSVTQALYAANLCADAARRSLQAEKYAGATQQIDALRGMTRQAMRDMRSLIFDLHPPELEIHGLVGAIQSRLNAVEGRSGMNPDLQITGLVCRLPLLVEEELFRIAIEALNNTAKHSQSTRVTVLLDYGKKNIKLTVEDNGIGCDLQSLPYGGMGLRGMRERAKRILGRLQINSKPGQGCLVSVVVSIDQRRE